MPCRRRHFGFGKLFAARSADALVLDCLFCVGAHYHDYTTVRALITAKVALSVGHMCRAAIYGAVGGFWGRAAR